MGRSSLPTSLWTLVALVISAYSGVLSHDKAAALLGMLSLPDFLAIPLAQQGEARIVHTLTGIIGGFITFFALGYLLPAVMDAIRLAVVSSDLANAYNSKRFNQPDRHPINEEWSLYPLFNRLWRDFAETLHPQSLDNGQRVVYRATSPAELYFNHQVLVDTPMRVEFFRHLPGILTGAGIISTFAGILLGLTEFDPMVGPDEVTGQLKNLFLGVSTAFVASFFAIFAAIVITVVEKLLLQWRYAQVTLLQGRVDDLFRGGVEPEYLAELAKGQGMGQVMERLDSLLQQFSQVNQTKPASDPLPVLLEKLLEEVKAVNQNASLQQGSLPSLLERLVGEINAGNEQRMGLLTKALQENLVSPLHGISQAVSAILAIYEAQRAAGDGGVGARIDQALERSSAIHDGIDQVRQELIQQGEKNAALSERSTNMLVSELSKAMREMTESSRESAQQRDAFLLARISASHGELAERVKENLQSGIEEGLKEPVQTILDKVQVVRDDQAAMHRQLTDAILEAFAHHLRESVNLLVNQMEGLGGRIADERKAMEAAFDRLATNLMEAAREGGDKLARQVELALGTAETRQDGMLEVLAKLSGDMRADINLLAQQIQQSGQDVTSRLSEHTLELAAQADEASRQLLQGAIEGSSQDLKDTLRALAEEQYRRNRERDDTLLQRLDFASAQVAQQLRQALQETEQERVERENQLEARHQEMHQSLQATVQGQEQERQSREQAMEAQRVAREQAMEQEIKEGIHKVEGQLADRIREFLLAEFKRSHEGMASLDGRIANSAAEQMRLTRELSDALMVAMASKVENTFGGLASGLNDLRASFNDERQSIEQSLQTWAEDLSQATRDGSDALAEQIRQVMNEAESRHQGVLQVLGEFSENLGSRMGRIHDGIVQRGSETISRLERVEGSILSTREDSSKQLASVANELQEQARERAEAMVNQLQAVVHQTSEEQATFIEALSERLDTLRKRLNINK
ncbi:MAG: hypothetical protein G8345_08285 [Magnetococcales bacterium]|nr:hypothetical protein [Magnetococcales bacterium]NGZ26873.1 hypothetical protein [Magnetococcales bacterium]